MKFKESKPIYLQIADRICDEILQGQYKEEERIPSVREYAATVEVNANTVVRSFDYLQNQEIIYNKRGLGYFVSQGSKLLKSAVSHLIYVGYNLYTRINKTRYGENLGRFGVLRPRSLQ